MSYDRAIRAIPPYRPGSQGAEPPPRHPCPGGSGPWQPCPDLSALPRHHDPGDPVIARPPPTLPRGASSSIPRGRHLQSGKRAPMPRPAPAIGLPVPCPAKQRGRVRATYERRGGAASRPGARQWGLAPPHAGLVLHSPTVTLLSSWGTLVTRTVNAHAGWVKREPLIRLRCK